jgi:hypothetical protein
MIPFEQMQDQHCESALQFVVLLVADVIELLGNVRGVDFRQAAFP